MLEFEVREATKFLAAQMGVSLGQRVYRMRRLRLADDVPIMVERTYLPAAQFIGLTRECLSSKPLYDVVEQEYNQKIKVAEEAFSARRRQRGRGEAPGDRGGRSGPAPGSHHLQRQERDHRVHPQRRAG